MKKCNKCCIEKVFSNFSKQPRNKDGYENQCKECRLNDHRRRKGIKKPSGIRVVSENEKLGIGKLCNKCKEDKLFSEFNKGHKLNKFGLNTYCKNCQSSLGKKYFKSNKSKVINKIQKRLNEDKMFKLKCNIRNLIRMSFKNLGYNKKSKTFQILGCTSMEFYNHIESQFVDGMNWDNRKLWHIDHIIPVSSVKTEEELIKLNHYTNLRPLWAIDNIRKSNRI
jgi:hypothetical protein